MIGKLTTLMFKLLFFTLLLLFLYSEIRDNEHVYVIRVTFYRMSLMNVAHGVGLLQQFPLWSGLSYPSPPRTSSHTIRIIIYLRTEVR